MPALDKLILMLSSDQDGEVVNAARAIGRQLKAEGHDWHWLVGKLTSQGPRPTQPDMGATAQDFRAPPSTYIARQMIDQLVRVCSRLSEREKEFVLDMKGRFAQYGSRTKLTTKQHAWIVGLHTAYCASGG